VVPGYRQSEEAVSQNGQTLVLATLCTLLFLTFLDNTVISVALGVNTSSRLRKLNRL
jgi:hypothetical protein